MRIAFFDSGYGGLSVLDAARRQHPEHQYLYYADSANAPYGSKPAAQVRDLVFAATDFIAAQQPEALVVACNTATAVCIETLRERYHFPVIGMEPAVKPALHESDNKRVLVMATSLTLQESKLSALLQRFDRQGRTDKLAMDRLVTFAEAGEFVSTDVETYLAEQLRHYRPEDYAAVVLGCTHFAYFLPLLRKLFLPSTSFVDGSAGTVRHLFRQLALLKNSEYEHRVQDNGGITFYRSGVATCDSYLKPYLTQLARNIDDFGGLTATHD